MKKLFTTILISVAVIMVILSLSACDFTLVDKVTPDNVTAGNVTPADVETADTTTSSEITFTERVVVDNEECFIKITDIDPTNIFGYTVSVLLENKSTERNYMFAVESAAINGVQCETLFATEVTAGKKAISEITFVEDKVLREAGVGEYTDIELTFRVYDSEDLFAADVADATVHIYPFGEEAAVTYVRESQPTDQVLLDNKFITVTVIGYEEDELLGYTVKLFLVNKTEVDVMFSASTVAVNDFMIDPLYADMVPAGKCAFSSMIWLDSDFEENGITSVENIDFVLKAYNVDNFLDEAAFAKEIITLTP